MQSDHLFEAVICAFTGFLWARDGWTLPAGADAAERADGARLADGWIWTPPASAAVTAAGARKSAEA